MKNATAKKILLGEMKRLQVNTVIFEEVANLANLGLSKKQISTALKKSGILKLDEQGSPGGLSPSEYQQMRNAYRQYGGETLVSPNPSPQSQDNMIPGAVGQYTPDGFGPAATTAAKAVLIRMIIERITGKPINAITNGMVVWLSQIPMSHWRQMWNNPSTVCTLMASSGQRALGVIALLWALDKATGGRVDGLVAQVIANYVQQQYIQDPLFVITKSGQNKICGLIQRAIMYAKKVDPGLLGVGAEAMNTIEDFTGGAKDGHRGTQRYYRKFGLDEALKAATTKQKAVYENFQKRMKVRLRAAHKRILDSGRADLVKVSAPFNAGRGKTSNAFLAKEGVKVKLPKVYHEEESLEEISAVATGAVAGFAQKLPVEEEHDDK